ncbi:uncharacterized protein LOC134535403 [Bacillus rossius redtenbacheri]|uniref:uncharacterized protein LOC134535403 n=1 Tax=Bacillus rossius redtenbacheri TaxID=93214 RepID=UPI002FDDEBD9
MASTAGRDPPPAAPEPPLHDVIIEAVCGGGDKLEEAARGQPPALPPRPPPRPRQPPGADLVEQCAPTPDGGGAPPTVLRHSCWLRKYVFLCTACGGLASLLGALFLTVYFMLRSYTSSLSYFETVPTYVPAAMLISTGMIVMCLAGRRNRFGYLIKVCGGCCLACAVLCVVVTITTTVIHMSRLQTLRQCVYTQKTQTCTCSSVDLDAVVSLETGNEGVHYVFNSIPDCNVVHGALYSCLRAMFGLSVIGIMVCLFSCMLVYQLLSHEKKKMYWEQLEMRCRYLYRQQRGPHHCSCCDECRYPEPFPWELMEDSRYWTPGRVGNLYSPNPGEEGSTRRAPSGWSWRRLPWARGTPPAAASPPTPEALPRRQVFSENQCLGSERLRRVMCRACRETPAVQRNTASSPDSQYGFSSQPAPAETADSAGGRGEPRTPQTPRPFVTEGSASYGQSYYMWGPPPPYSNPHSHCGSPARTAAPGLARLHHHHHHHHCSHGDYRHRAARPHFDDFSSGEGVVGPDDEKTVRLENYVNTGEVQVTAGNTTGDNTDSSEGKERLNNTLPARKAKKRMDMSALKTGNFPYGADNQGRSLKNSPGHFAGTNSDRGVHGLCNQGCRMGDRCHDQLMMDDGEQFQVSLPLSVNVARTGEGCMSPRARYVAHLQGHEVQGHTLCGKVEPTESEVYFADVSSCCNVSVRNDGQDSSLYDEAVDPRKQRSVSVAPGTAEAFHHHHHRQLHEASHGSTPGTGHHLFQQSVLITDKDGQHNHHHHAMLVEKNINNADLSGNAFNYQRQSSTRGRLQYPVAFHEHVGEHESVTEEEVAESVHRKNSIHACREFMEMDIRKGVGMTCPRPDMSKDCLQHLTLATNCPGSDASDGNFISPMSISTPSSDGFTKEQSGCNSSYYNNQNSPDMTPCPAQSPGGPPNTVHRKTYEQNRLQNNNFQSGANCDFAPFCGRDQLFLAPDAQYETIAQQPRLRDMNGNGSTGCTTTAMSPGRRRPHPALRITAGNNNGAESLYQAATSTEDESESQQPQSNCYSDATMDSGCHSGSEFAASASRTPCAQEPEEGVPVSAMRSVNV